MEGDGEGLVAIVEGLDTSGVTLTVCNRPRHNSRNSRHRIQINAVSSMPSAPAVDQRHNSVPAVAATPAVQRSSVETGTGTEFSRLNTASQICDGRYASVYKMSHCMFTPTSPPEAVSEFPPQRKDPSRDQGNFEIGGHGSSKWSRSGQPSGHGSGQTIGRSTGQGSGHVRASSSRVRHCGGSQTWAEKGSSHRYSKSYRETEAFAHSLRKYPNMAPFRTASTDLIEKLIRYTQAKNFQEMSRSTKSMRSLRQQKSSDSYDANKASKHQQTYTRRQDDVPSPSTAIGSRGKTRNFKLYSPMSDCRNLKENRNMDTTFSCSYDYLKAGSSPYGRSNRSNESQSPTGSRSPEGIKSPEGTRSPERPRSPDRPKTSDRFRSPTGSKSPEQFRSRDGSKSPSLRPVRFDRSVRDLSLSEMSKYIRSTIRQICSERPVVFQVCPKLKSRMIQHKKVCSNKNARPSDAINFQENDQDEQASGSVISHLIKSIGGCDVPSTVQVGCQCPIPDCYCTKATQCVNNPDATKTLTCNCKTLTGRSCCRTIGCICSTKGQNQAYYNQRIDEEISEWLKEVPVHGIEGLESKHKRDKLVKHLRESLKQLPDDDSNDENVENKIEAFVNNFPIWNPGKDKNDDKLFKNKLADKLIERIVAVQRKPDRFKEIVKKWVADIDFQDESNDLDMEDVIDNFVNKLKDLAADRPTCDIKYKNVLRKEITELLSEFGLRFDGGILMLHKMANKLAIEIVKIPKNVKFSEDVTNTASKFEENVTDWICEHGLCEELKKNPKLIESLAKKIKFHEIDDEVGKMREEVQRFIDDVNTAFETIDKLIEELLQQLSKNSPQTKENKTERIDLDELTEIIEDWLNDLPGVADLSPQEFEKMTQDLVKVIKEGKEQKNENLANDVFNIIANVDLPIKHAVLGTHVEDLMEVLNIVPSDKFFKEQAKREMLNDILEIIESSPITEDKKEEMRQNAYNIVEKNLRKTSFYSKEALNDSVSDVNQLKTKTLLDYTNINNVVDRSPFSKDNSAVGYLTESLSTVASRYVYICKLYPKSVCDIQSKLERDIGIKIDESSIDPGKKSKLKKIIRHILADNENRRLSDEVVRTIRTSIDRAVSDLSIPQDKKDALRKRVRQTVWKDLNEAFLDLRQDLNKMRKKLTADMTSIIEKSPISKDLKTQLKHKVKSALVGSSDSSRSLDIHQKEATEMFTEKMQKDFDQMLNEFPIDSGVKEDVKKEINDMLAETLYEHLTDEVQQKIKDDILRTVDEMDISEHDKKNLKSNISKGLTKQLNKLTDQGNDVREIKAALGKTIKNEIINLPVSKDKQELLEHNLKDVLIKHLVKPITDEKKDMIRERLSDIVNDHIIDKDISDDLKTQLLNSVNNDFDEMEKEGWPDNNQSNFFKEIVKTTQDNIVREMGKVIEDGPLSGEMKREFKEKMKDIAIKNSSKPLDVAAEALRDGVYKTLEKLNLPKDKKNKLQAKLISALDENMSKFQREIKGLMPVQAIDDTNVKERILQGLEKIIQESSIPENKKIELKNIVANDLKQPFSNGVQDAVKIDATDLIEELRIPRSEKNKLKSAITDMVDETVDALRSAPHRMSLQDNNFQDLVGTTQDNILREMDQIIEEVPLPREKKRHLQNKLKDMTAKNLIKSTDYTATVLRDGINDILDDFNLPKDKKNKLQTELINAVDENMSNLQREIKDKYKKSIKSPIHEQEFDKYKAKESILQGIENIIEVSPIPKEEKIELKKNLKDLVVDILKEPFSKDMPDAIKTDAADIIEELHIPRSEKYKLKSSITEIVDETVDTLQSVPRRLSLQDNNFQDLVETTQDNILKDIDQIIEEVSLPREKKLVLQKRLKDMTTKNLTKPADYGAEALKNGVTEILEEVNLPKDKISKLQNELISAVDENMTNLQREIKGTDTNVKFGKSGKGLMLIQDVKNYATDSILQGIEKVVEESAIPKEKKMDIEKNLKKMAADYLKQPLSKEVQEAIKTDAADIIEELQIPRSEKNKLKSDITDMVNETVDTFPSASRKFSSQNDRLQELIDTTQDNILREMEQSIEEVSLPRDKKLVLKKKLKDLTTKNLMIPFDTKPLHSTAEALKDGVNDILYELNLLKDTKNTLQSELISVVDDNMKNLQGEIEGHYRKRYKGMLPVQEVDKTKAKESILQEIDNILEGSAIPEENKMEIEKNLKKMAADYLKLPLSKDVQDAIKTDAADIIEELHIPRSEKNKLKSAISVMVDEIVDTLPSAPLKYSLKDDNFQDLVEIIQDNVLREMNQIIDSVPIPRDKKRELKKKMKDMTTRNLTKPIDYTPEALRDSVNEILEELNLPKDMKSKLQSELIGAVDENMNNLQREIKGKYRKSDKGLLPVQEVDKTKAKESILQGIGNIIEGSNIPEEKKMDIEKNLNKMVADYLKQPLSKDLQDAIKIDAADIIEEVRIPRSEKNILKSAITDMVDETIGTLRSAPRKLSFQDDRLQEFIDATQDNILREMDQDIEKVPLPREKRLVLKKKLKDMTTTNFSKPLDSTAEALKDGVNDILDEFNLPKDKKNRLQIELISAVDDNMGNLQKEIKGYLPFTRKSGKGLLPVQEIDETKAKESILQGIDNIIEGSAIPEEKKVEVEKNLNKMVADYLKQPLSKDVQDAIKIDAADIIEEVRIPRSEKNKLKSAITDMVDETVDTLRSAPRRLSLQDDIFQDLVGTTQGNIIRDMDQIIEDVPLPREKKRDLKNKLKDMTTKNFIKPTDHTAKVLKDGINDILDDFNLPKDKKNILQSQLISAVDENMSNLQRETKDKYKKSIESPILVQEFDKTKAKESIMQGIEKIIEDSDIPKGIKIDLKKNMKDLVVDILKQPFSKDVPDAIKTDAADIIEELHIPRSEKYKLKSSITEIVDETVDTFQIAPRKFSSQDDRFQELIYTTQDNILREMDQAIKDVPVHREKKRDLKKKLKDVITKNLTKPSDYTTEALKDGVNDILDELNIPKDKKNKLQSELISAVDDNMSNLQKEIKSPYISNSRPSKQQLLKEKKTILKIEPTDAVDENMSNKFQIKVPFTGIMSEPSDLGIKEYRSPFPQRTIDETNISQRTPREVHKDVDDLRDTKQVQHLKEIESETKNNILLGFEKSTDEALIPSEKKKDLKKHLNDLATKNFKKPLSEDVAEALKNGVNKILDEQNLPSDIKNELKSLLTTTVDENINDFKTQRNYVKSPHSRSYRIKQQKQPHPKPEIDPSNVKESMKHHVKKSIDVSRIADSKKGKLQKELLTMISGLLRMDDNEDDDANIHEELKMLYDKYGIDPSYQKQLDEEFDNLLKIALEGGDFEEARRKLIEKLMREQGLSREQAAALADELINKAREMALRKGVGQAAMPEFKDKITGTIKTWMDSLSINLDPDDVEAIPEALASDVLDRLKFLQAHPEIISTDENEIKNLKYQVFRRLNTISIVDPKDMPKVMEKTEDLYNMIMEIEPPTGFPKLQRSEQTTSERRRRDQVAEDKKKSTSTALSTGNIKYSLKDLVATNKNVRKQWFRNLDDAITKLPLSKTEKHLLKDKLAFYDETGQINMLSSHNVHDAKSNKYTTSNKTDIDRPHHIRKTDSLAFCNTSKQSSPFNINSKEATEEKEFTKYINTTVNTWLESARLNIKKNQKNKIVEELTRDIVDRHKYLQTFANAEQSQSDHLQSLQLQVHRRLNAVLPAEELKRVMERTKELLEKVNVNVPQLVIPPVAKVSTSPIAQKSGKTKQIPSNVQKIPEKAINTSVNGVPPQTVSTSPIVQKSGKTKQLPSNVQKIREKATNTSDNGAPPHTVQDDVFEEELSGLKLASGQTSTPYGSKTTQETSEDKDIKQSEAEYIATITESIKTWLENQSIDLEPVVKNDVIKGLTDDVVDRQKYLQIHPERTFSKKDEAENLRFQVFKRLNKVMDPDSPVTSMQKIEELYKMIAGDGRRKSLTPKQAEEFRPALNTVIAAILDDYNICCDRRELLPNLANELFKLIKSDADQDEIVENLISIIKDLTYIGQCVCDEEAEELAHKLLYRTKKLIGRIQDKDNVGLVKKKDFKKAVLNEIGDVFHDYPMSRDKKKLMENQLAEDLAKDLGVPLEDSDLTINGTGSKSKERDYGMSFNGLSNFIDTWLSSIHTDDDTKGEDEIKDMKKDMAYSLIHKIGEMNVDPEIFNDNALYEAILRDELQNLLGDVTITDNEIQALKEDLIEKLLEAQKRAHDELAGQTYKQNLRDTISKHLPDQRNLSKEDQAAMETLKDQLADAYIDLHFSGNNERQREQLKRKISNEIKTFCRDYLNKIPCSPLNNQRLNQDIYTALNNVSLPAGDSIKYEVEQARIREQINDWIKELPLELQNPTDILARNKLVYILSKKLFDIEVEGDDDNKDESMRKEIVRFLSKIPLEPRENKDELADKLIDKLKNSQESRKFDASSNVYIDAFGNVSAVDASLCPTFRSVLNKRKNSGLPMVCEQPTCSGTRHSGSFPPSNLSPEDRAHLDRIRRRTCLSPSFVKSLMSNSRRNSSVGPQPVDAGSQTVLRPLGISATCSAAFDKKPCPGIPSNLPPLFCPHGRSFGIEKPQQTYEKTPRPCPGLARSTPQPGPSMRRHMISSSNMTDCRGEIQPQIIVKEYYWDPDNKNDESDLQQNGRGQRRPSDTAPCPPNGAEPSFSQLQQQTSLHKDPGDLSYTCPGPTCPRQLQSDRRSYWSPQRSFHTPSQRDVLRSRSPCTPSPCTSQSRSPIQSPGMSKRNIDCRMPKRDGLQDHIPCSSRPSRRERVIELGSLDDLRSPRPKKQHSDHSDWPSAKEDDNFWNAPMRRVILDEGIDGAMVMEREQREERVRCRCKERLVPKCGRSQSRNSPSQMFTNWNENGQNLKRCSKCCGLHCPYPSFMYFRQ